MLDLLGDEIVVPQESPEYGFAEFWAEYPAGNRRVAKPQCARKWATLGCAQIASHIIAHVKHMKSEDCWQRGFHPMVATYLNQQRWVDWVAPAPVKPRVDALEVIKAHKGAPMPESVRARLAALRQGAPA